MPLYLTYETVHGGSLGKKLRDPKGRKYETLLNVKYVDRNSLSFFFAARDRQTRQKIFR